MAELDEGVLTFLRPSSQPATARRTLFRTVNSADTQPTPSPVAGSSFGLHAIGFLLALPVATFVLFLALSDTGLPSRFALSGIVAWTLFVAALNAPFALILFLIIRLIAVRHGLSRFIGGLCWGAISGILYIPFGIATAHAFDFEGSLPAYPIDLARTLSSGWHVYFAYGIAGATGGLCYWLFAYSGAPALLFAAAADRRSVPFAGRVLSRRVVYGLLSAVVVVGAAIGIDRWWQPHIEGSSGSGMPTIALEREISIGQDPQGVAWSRDGSSLISHNANVVWFDAGDARDQPIHQVKARPALSPGLTPIFVHDRKFAVMTGAPQTSPSDAAFSVIELATGEVVHQEPTPLATRIPVGMRPASMAKSPDETLLAASFSDGSQEAIVFYSTVDWSIVHILRDFPPHTPFLVSLTFSPDGRKIALVAGLHIFIIDVATASLSQSIDFVAAANDALAFSPDGRRLAAAGDPPDAVKKLPYVPNYAVHIFSLADGTEIASYGKMDIFSPHLAWSPRDNLVAFVDPSAVIRFWNPVAGSEKSMQLRSHVTGISFSPNGEALAIANGGDISIFRIAK
ncbi:MAG TPA: hypothetical protein VGL83_16765 [Stellaceae bacterium]